MKELTIEQKAKAYDEDIKKIENIKTGKCETTFLFTEGLFEHIFPELKEPNDEKIRKELIDAIQGLWDDDALPMPLSVKRKDAWLAWLEKQAADKPYYTELLGYFEDGKRLNHSVEEIIDWLKSKI